MLKQCMEQIDLLEKQRAACLNHLEELAERYFAREISLLCTIRGIQNAVRCASSPKSAMT